ncbi:MAG TPA: hypothetical protein VNY76_06070 [Candidatus Acidoferrales bacterium]|nr:hypothetical protein [Candidatus Acidoferrales bacterium]
MHTRRFFYSLTVAAAAVSFSLAAHVTTAVAAERDHDRPSRAQQLEPAAARERSHDHPLARFRAASHGADSPHDEDVEDGHRRGGSVLKAPMASSASAVRAIAPSVAPAPPPARAQQTAVLITPVLSFPTLPVAPPASGSVVIGGTQPPLNLATVITLVVAAAVALLATHLARRPA